MMSLYNQSLKKLKPLLGLISQKTWDFFITDAEKQGFEDREGQQDMAFDIVDAIAGNQHLVVEAGVGIGKSFAYIVPLLLFNKYFNWPVAISTSTITLQEQLEKDIETVSRLIGYHPQVVLAKGQTHFVCLKRAEDYLSGKKDSISTSIKKELKAGISDRRDFKTAIDLQTWDCINIKDFSFKTCSACSSKNDCYFASLRAQMKMTSGVILCNHDLLTSHLHKVNRSQRPLLNPFISLIVVDEAHNLEEKVRSSLTVSFNKAGILSSARSARKAVKVQGTDLDKHLSRLSPCLDALYDRFEKQINEQIRQNPYDMKYAERFSVDFGDDLHPVLEKVTKCISELNSEIDLLYGDFSSDSTDYAVESLENTADFFYTLLSNSESQLYWLERTKGAIYLCSCPKDIAKVTRGLYFERDGSTILTSATIANSTYGDNQKKYAYFATSTGFPVDGGRGFLSDPKPSPFPYDEHTMLYYCTDLPHPTKERRDFIAAGTDRLIDLLKISDGRALVLFTAKADLEEVYERLNSFNLPYKILMQRGDASQEKVLAEFRENVSSVLLGTGAYWEGINIEGESLSNLIVFRLPFPVPDPIIEYKRSIAKDPLMDVNVPEMIIKLKQGVGRLIRSYDDKGIVSIIDPRMGETSTAPYKEQVWDALPVHKKTSSLSELKKFYDIVVRNP